MAAPAGPEAETCLLFIQVGGGALASSTVQALAEAADLGVLAGRPPLYPVQSEGCAPLDRAFRLVRQLDDPLTAITNTDDSDFMWPWDDPSSLATGILDDIVYDWQPIVATMLEDGSSPVVATEAEVAEPTASSATTPRCLPTRPELPAWQASWQPDARAWSATTTR
jgi:hypothetical protein